MKHIVILLFLSLFIVEPAHAQYGETVPLSYVILGDVVRENWELWKKSNEQQEDFRAWRILVAGVESRRAMDSHIEKFKRSFPELNYDWDYDPPIYKLKTGIFLDRLDAKPLLYKIKETFPAALEIRDLVGYEAYFEELEK